MAKQNQDGPVIPEDMEGREKMIVEQQKMLDKLLSEVEQLNEQIVNLDENLTRANELTVRQAGEIKVLKAAQDTTQPAVKVDGFVLMPGDPFAQGTMRHYLNLCGGKCKQPPYLPFTLPFKDARARQAAVSYGIRAQAAGDRERVEALRKALDKFTAR